jgi:hypothetical protein
MNQTLKDIRDAITAPKSYFQKIVDFLISVEDKPTNQE